MQEFFFRLLLAGSTCFEQEARIVFASEALVPFYNLPGASFSSSLEKRDLTTDWKVRRFNSSGTKLTRLRSKWAEKCHR